MNSIISFSLKCLRHGYQGIFGKPAYDPPPLYNIEEGNELIYQTLSKVKPCMIARYGANELNCVSNYLEIKNGDRNVWKNITGRSHDWWWNQGMKKCMEVNAGFFPINNENLDKFSELMLADSEYLDVLAVFPAMYDNIRHIKSYIPQNIPFINLVSFDSFLYERPWTRILEGKNVLVVHPFAKLIKKQYSKRKLLFRNQDVLPFFHLRTIEAVQSIGGGAHGFMNWFDALDWMKNEMDKEPYDICLIGCGAYGFPLAAHAKRTGHQAIHIGGSLQLLFGIKGKRWEDPKYGPVYGLSEGSYSKLMDNPSWVRPEEYRTKQSENVEGACYW